MGPQDTSVLQEQYHRFPGRSSDVDFEAAEQLLQHSRRGRESNGDSISSSAVEPEVSTNSAGSNGERGLGNGPFENGNENGESHLQERHADAQYAPINNPPPQGQACRYAQNFALQVRN